MMRIAKSRLKEIILEELGSIEDGAPSLTQGLEEELLNENMLASLAPKVIEFVIKSPKIMEMLAKALGPMLAKTMGGEAEEGGAAGGAMADLAGAVGGITEE